MESTRQNGSLRSDNLVLSASGMIGQLRRQGGNAAHVARSPQLNSWMLSCTSDLCRVRDRRTAHSADRTFSADGSRRQDEDQGAGADARELQDAELEATTTAACQRGQGVNNEGPVGMSLDSALAGLGWVKASLLRDHQALATAQELPPKPKWRALQRPRSH